MDKKLMLSSYLKLAEALPLKEDDVLFIASDLHTLAKDAKSRGERFDVNAFIESFQSVLVKGTIVIPAYTDNLWNHDTFDIRKSKPTTGAMSNKVFRRTDFSRTSDPLHSVFVWGRDMNEIMELNPTSTFGEDSVFGFLYRRKAKMICIDVHLQNSFTFVHYVEEKLRVKYRKHYHLNLTVIDKDGRETLKRTGFHTKRPWILTDLYDLQQSFGADGIKQNYKFGHSKIQYFELEKAHDYVIKYIRSGKRLYQVDLTHFIKRVIKRLIGRK
jgi:aminoglycoside 3-N-acetyltransferase